VSAPPFQILTQKELVIDLSRPAMEQILQALEVAGYGGHAEVQAELDNFRNLLQNLLERSETGNLDLIGG
jgi:hypothetical protein